MAANLGHALLPRSQAGDAIASPEAEQALLGGLMMSPNLWEQLQARGLTREAFHDPGNQAVWQALDSLRRSGGGFDYISVLDALRSAKADKLAGGMARLLYMAEAARTPAHTEKIAELVLEKARRRRLDEIGKAIRQAAAGPLPEAELRGRMDALSDELLRYGAPLAPRNIIPVEWASDLPEELQAPEQLVEGVLTAGGMSMFYGESNSGKSYLAIHLGICVSQGLPWLGRRATKGAVLYVAAEGAWSIRLRLAAHRKHFERDIGRFGLIPAALGLVDPSEDVDNLIALIQARAAEMHGPVRLVIVDTVARVMGGGDENTAQDMGRLVTAGDRIRSATGAHLLYIHHAGKDASRGARGHSSLRAALDTEVEVTADETTKIHTAQITKQRDLPSKGDKLAGRFISVDLGTDQWGGPVTACAVEDAQALDPMPRPRKAPGSEVAVLQHLRVQVAGVRRAQVFEALEKALGLSRTTVYDAISRLIAAGTITDNGGILHAINS